MVQKTQKKKDRITLRKVRIEVSPFTEAEGVFFR